MVKVLIALFLLAIAAMVIAYLKKTGRAWRRRRMAVLREKTAYPAGTGALSPPRRRTAGMHRAGAGHPNYFWRH